MEYLQIFKKYIKKNIHKHFSIILIMNEWNEFFFFIFKLVSFILFIYLIPFIPFHPSYCALWKPDIVFTIKYFMHAFFFSCRQIPQTAFLLPASCKLNFPTTIFLFFFFFVKRPSYFTYSFPHNC